MTNGGPNGDNGPASALGVRAGIGKRLARARDGFFGIPAPVAEEWSECKGPDLRERRDRTEDIANQRIGFMLVFVALVVGGAFAASNAFLAKCLLTWGFAICGLIVPTIWRAHTRHRFVCKVLAKAKPGDIATMVADKLTPKLWNRSMKDLIGYWLPAIVAFSLLVVAVLGWIDLLPLDGEKEKTAMSVRFDEDAHGNFVMEFLDDDGHMCNKQATTPAAAQDLCSQLHSAVTTRPDATLPKPRPASED